MLSSGQMCRFWSCLKAVSPIICPQSRPVNSRYFTNDAGALIDYLIRMSHDSTKRPLRIAIEGNIASGKSTIIEYLKRSCISIPNLENNTNRLSKSTNFGEIKSDFKTTTIDSDTSDFFTRKNVNLRIYTEPVHLWRDLNGHNLLEHMYKDPQRYSFAFHSYVQLTMLENHMKISQPAKADLQTDLENVVPGGQTNQSEKFNINVMERSLYSAKYCFLENIYKAGKIEPVEYEILDKWYTWMTKEHDCELDIIFYLRTSPQTCYNRLNVRGRPEETSSITLDYLQSLHDLHESWLIRPSDHPTSFLVSQANIYRPQNIIVIDADQSLDNVFRNIETETRLHATSVA